MNTKKTELYFLFAMIAVATVLSFFIFNPFLYAMILAVVTGTVCEPLHQRLLKKTGGKKGLSAFIATLGVFLIIVIPVTFLGTQILQEATTLYFSVTGDGAGGVSEQINNAILSVKDILRIDSEVSIDIARYAQYATDWLLQHLGSIFSNLATFSLNLLIFLFALYYVFKDGAALRRALIVFSPLKNAHDETVLKKITEAINSVVRGSLAVALIQGLLTAIGFLLFGVPSPALWGSVAAIAALIPALGTALVLVPAVLFLFITGKTTAAIGLFVWAVLAVGLVDNFLGPRLVDRGIKLHPFLILLSIVGGISFFGPLGLLFGPLVLSFLHSLIQIYFVIQKENQ